MNPCVRALGSQTDRPTRPCPADQSAPLIPSPSSLADVALAAGIEAELVRGYLSHRHAHMSAPYAFIAACVGLVHP